MIGFKFLYAQIELEYLSKTLTKDTLIVKYCKSKKYFINAIDLYTDFAEAYFGSAKIK
ncbi:MAG: hypothetical protein MUE91_10040 [Ignavibacteriaceae bacterium]|jgi:hypothetical protein|nr:hypothetical protein [Ignavibacteriaceae bacterium]